MSFSYKSVPLVKSGDPITSSQYNALADAINDRLKNGVADCSWRLFWYADALFQYIRLGDGLEQPARDEWWSHWCHIKPENGKDWPLTDVGTNGGINASNPIAAFVYGNESLDIYNEADRLNYDPVEQTGIKLHEFLSGAPTSDLDHWELGKVQRGAIPSTLDDLSASNALLAADEYYKINYGATWSYLKGYGGFHAGPRVSGVCADDPTYDEYEIKFRHIDTGCNCTYTTCRGQSGTEPSSPTCTGLCVGHTKPVQGWFAGVYGYVLYHYDGTITTLPYTDYLEGPYTENAFLRHERGGQLDFALYSYASEFRGADYSGVSQRNESTWNPQKHAFRFEDFFTQQYYLAPAYGSGPYGLTGSYPNFDFANGTTSGSFGIVNSATSYTIHSGFCFAGLIAVGSDIDTPKTFGVYVNDELVYTHSLEAGADVDKSHWFKSVFPAGSVVKIKCNDAYAGSEEAYIEIAEIMEMSPRVQDAYVVTRMASSVTQTMDGWGHQEPDAKDVWDRYQRHGMAVNYSRDSIQSAGEQSLWKNPVYEETRRIVRDNLRLVKRNHLQGYEINGSGNSVLYFTRSLALFGGGSDGDVDLFEGIAPSPDAISTGFIKAGVRYKVTGSGASISYDGVVYTEGNIFIGKYKVKNWTTISGTPVIYENDIIITKAPKQGETNEWQVFLQTLPYKDSNSHLYKPEVFADRDGMFVDRCTLLSSSWGGATDQSKEIRAHVYARQRRPINRQENPSGYRYILGTNLPEEGNSKNLVGNQNTSLCSDPGLADELECYGQVAHYKSCQVYVPDYQVQSVTYDSGTGLVAVELDGRLRHNDNVTGQAVANNSGSWEDYMLADDNDPTGPAAARSDENAVIEYLNYKAGNGECTIRIGDQSGDAGADGSWDSYWDAGVYNGACFPRFHFNKLMPKVYADGNNNLDDHDTRMTIDNIRWAGFVLRAICEGYLDLTSDASLVEYYIEDCNTLPFCGQNRMYDYRYSTLMLQAMGNRWFTMHPATAEGDNWEGYGPFPQMECYAAHFNQLGKALNLLTRARLDLPVYGVRWRTRSYSGFVPLSPEASCTYQLSQGIPDQVSWTDTATGSWQYDVPGGACLPPIGDAVAIQASKSAVLDTVGGICGISITRTDVEYEVGFGSSGVEAMAYYALPDDLKEMITVLYSRNNNSSGFMAAEYIEHDTASASVWDGSGTPDPCSHNVDGTVYEFTQSQEITSTCKSVVGGTLEAEKPRQSAYTNNVGTASCSVGATSRKTLAFDSIRAIINVPLR